MQCKEFQNNKLLKLWDTQFPKNLLKGFYGFNLNRLQTYLMFCLRKN